MMSDDFRRFLTYLPTLKSDVINGRSLGQKYPQNIWSHMWMLPKAKAKQKAVQNYLPYFGAICDQRHQHCYRVDNWKYWIFLVIYFYTEFFSYYKTSLINKQQLLSLTKVHSSFVTFTVLYNAFWIQQFIAF